MSILDMGPQAIEERILIASALSDLSPATRLDAKLDMSPGGIARRIQEASDLRLLCQKLAASKP